MEQGLEVWRTPDVVTWSGLVERLFTLERQAGRVEGRWLPDSAARLVWEQLAERDPATAGLVSPGLLGRSAYESWRRMHAYQIPPEVIAAGDTPETAAFARWANEYTAWLDRHQWVDESRAVARFSPDASGTALEFVGFDALTPAQQSYLQRLERSGAVVTHPPAGQADGSVIWVEYVDRIAEYDAAARWAAQRLERRPEDRLAIVVPGLAAARDTVRRVIERVLVPAATLAGGPAPESQGYELAAARALSERPLPAAALEVVDAFARTADLTVASRLLRSSFLSGSATEADARARLDARIRRGEGPDLGLSRLARLAADHHCPVFAQACGRGLDWCRTGRGAHCRVGGRDCGSNCCTQWAGQARNSTAQSTRRVSAGRNSRPSSAPATITSVQYRLQRLHRCCATWPRARCSSPRSCGRR